MIVHGACSHAHNSRHIELRLLAGAVAAQRAVFADRVGALEDPVLPRGEAREDFRFHGLGADEAQVRFHAGEAVGREGGALLEEHPHLVVPVDVVEREGDEAELFGLLGVERRADGGFRALEIGRIGLEARLQPGQAVAHRIGAEIHRGELRSPAARGCRPAASRSACRSGRRRTRVRRACRRSRSRARPASPACAR